MSLGYNTSRIGYQKAFTKYLVKYNHHGHEELKPNPCITLLAKTTHHFLFADPQVTASFHCHWSRSFRSVSRSSSGHEDTTPVCKLLSWMVIFNFGSACWCVLYRWCLLDHYFRVTCHHRGRKGDDRNQQRRWIAHESGAKGIRGEQRFIPSPD